MVLSEKLLTELHFLGNGKHQVVAISKIAWNNEEAQADVQLIIIRMFSERVQISINTLSFLNCFIKFWVLRHAVSASDFVLLTEKNTLAHQSFYANIWVVA